MHRNALWQLESPEPNVENSAQFKMYEYGHVMDEPYQCIHCHPVRTQASEDRTIMNVEKYMVSQLKIFNYDDQVSKDFNKTVANLVIEEKIHNMLLGTFQLQAIILSYWLLSFSRTL